MRSVLILFILIRCVGLTAQPVYEARVIEEPQQTIRGWGIFAGKLTPGTFNILDKPEIRMMLYGDLGINTCRIQLLPEFYQEETGAINTELIDSTLVLQINQITPYYLDTNYITSIWSPPAAFKKCPTLKGKCPDGSPNTLPEQSEDVYVRFITETLMYLRHQGIPLPKFHSIQNELDYAPDWEGCAIPPEQWRRLLRKFRAAFNANGLHQVGLMGPETASYEGAIRYMGGRKFSALDDSELDRQLSAFTTHGYGSGSWNSAEGNNATILRNGVMKAANAGLSTWMSEWSLAEGNTPMQMSINAMRRLGREMVYIPFENWIWWLGWRNKYDREALIFGDEMEKTPLFYALKVLWNHVRPGYVVKHMITDDPDLIAFDPQHVDLVAWDGKDHLVVLVVNHTTHEKRFNFQNLTGDKADVYYIDELSEGEKSMEVPIQNGVADLVPIPGETICLLITNKGGMNE